MDGQTLIVLTTLGTADRARALVRTLVEARLVACGTIVPGVTSVFRWEGAVQEEGEVLVVLKTRAERWEALRAAVETAHPYDVPELLAVPVTAGLAPYLAWVARETDQEDAG